MQGRRKPALKHMSFEQRAVLQKNYVATLPGWRHPTLGYLICTPLVALAMFSTLAIQNILTPFFFPGSLLTLAVLMVALFWGVGPALCSILVGTVLVDYYLLLPLYPLPAALWSHILQLIPFVFTGLTIAIITAQRERARLNALAAEYDSKASAEELKEANTKLEDANRLKDHFISIASHELKTPITSMRGLVYLIQRRLSKHGELPPDLKDIVISLEKIDDQISRLASLTDDLLDVSRIRTGKIELHLKKWDLNEICREVVEDQQFLTDRLIALHIPDRPVKAEVDRYRFSQVLVNLIGNALKYSPEHAPVEVSIAAKNHKGIIQIRDYGKGIPPDQQTAIFEAFYRTPEAEASAQSGLGLGLAISKDIVERHRGRIWCQSEPDQGSTFFVELLLK